VTAEYPAIATSSAVTENKLGQRATGVVSNSRANLSPSTWKEEPPALHGRVDLAYDGESTIKALEFNADTPTALLKAAVIQWYWLQDTHKDRKVHGYQGIR